MMRQSVAPNRMSQAPNANSAATSARMIEKKKEYDAVSALERASALYLERISDLSLDFDVMADGGEVFGEVLEQWPKMFQILSLFIKARAEGASEGEPETEVVRDLLVGIPIEALQNTETSEIDKST